MSAPDRIVIAGGWGECGNYYPNATEAEGEHGGVAIEYIRADLMPQWMPIDENTPKDVILLLGWLGYGDKWETSTDYWHNSRGGWRHGSATYYQIITPPPAS